MGEKGKRGETLKLMRERLNEIGESIQIFTILWNEKMLRSVIKSQSTMLIIMTCIANNFFFFGTKNIAGSIFSF